jgi:hypothetical protein
MPYTKFHLVFDGSVRRASCAYAGNPPVPTVIAIVRQQTHSPSSPVPVLCQCPCGGPCLGVVDGGVRLAV